MQLAEVGSTTEGSPLAQLCTDTLATIASPLGGSKRKRNWRVSPTSELAEATNTVGEAKALSLTSRNEY